MKEEWRDIVVDGMPIFSGVYMISSLGQYKRKDGKAPCRFINHPQGYVRAQLSVKGKKKFASIHRLVASAFLPNPENKSQVNHKNGIKDDNRVENLEWITAKENIQHSLNVLGKKRSHGETHCHSRFKESDVRWMRAWWNTGEVTQAEIGKMYSTSQAVVQAIVQRKTWKHVA